MSLKMKFWGRPAMEIPTFKLIRPHLVFYSIGSGKKCSIIFILKNNNFSVFWDLYSAHPDKKDKAEPSNDAKSYHKMVKIIFIF